MPIMNTEALRTRVPNDVFRGFASAGVQHAQKNRAHIAVGPAWFIVWSIHRPPHAASRSAVQFVFHDISMAAMNITLDAVHVPFNRRTPCENLFDCGAIFGV